MTAVFCIAPVRTASPVVGDEDLGIEHNEKLHLDLKRMSVRKFIAGTVRWL